MHSDGCPGTWFSVIAGLGTRTPQPRYAPSSHWPPASALSSLATCCACTVVTPPCDHPGHPPTLPPQFKRILLMVSHSQDFLNGVCTNIIHMQKKKLNYYSGGCGLGWGMGRVGGWCCKTGCVLS